MKSQDTELITYKTPVAQEFQPLITLSPTTHFHH